ncbi:hypothetical protein M9H77_19792 [Catharanthus roseus]|uniref:Uncharacterized protein n=1 Tax=Catharanthus roseus TaxID=4058 RepID=A0ACC0BBF3_CATRO|nr:hypothetical protein M9H77_19792 [Catharanthus roseus]
MGRKIEIKKIQDNIKAQVTFSKRRTSLLKKAKEIATVCDVDIAFLVFSRSGRVSEFCTQQRMEDLLERYINVPVDKRLRIKNLKTKIEMSQIQVQLAESDLRDFEPKPEIEPTLHQLSWCERNLLQSIQKLKGKLKETQLMENEAGMPSLYNQEGNNHYITGSNPSNVNLQNKVDAQGYKYPQSIFTVLIENEKDKGKGKAVVEDYGPSKTTMENNIYNASFPVSYGMHQFGVQGNQTGPSYTSLENNTFNGQVPDLTAYAPSMIFQNGTFNAQTNGTFNAQTYNLTPYAPISQGYQVWGETPMACQNGNFTNGNNQIMENVFGSHFTGLPESNFNNVTNTMVVPENYLVQNQPNMPTMNSITNGNAYNEIIMPMTTSVQDLPSTSGTAFPDDISSFFIPEKESTLSLVEKSTKVNKPSLVKGRIAIKQ